MSEPLKDYFFNRKTEFMEITRLGYNQVGRV